MRLQSLSELGTMNFHTPTRHSKDVIFLDRKALRAAFSLTVPVLMGYLAIGMVFGWMLSAIGYGPLWALLMSCTMYAGSGQYLAVGLIEQAAPLTTMIFLTFVISFRHMVYGLSLLNKLKGGGWRKLYTIFALTDETYALLAGVTPPDGVDEKRFFFWIALLDHIYWIAGSMVGALAGSLITINTEGIDFAMTALFLVIAVGQWQSSRSHFPALLGAGGTLVCLLIFGGNNGQFLIPALIVLVIGLLCARPKLDRPEDALPQEGADAP